VVTIGDSEAQVRQHTGTFDGCRLEPYMLAAGYREQADAVAEQNRGEVNDELIEQAALQ
jgi:hypothetical protein